MTPQAFIAKWGKPEGIAGAIRDAVARHRSANPRVFGSVVIGSDSEGSDIDLLVDPLPGATLFDLGGLQGELEDLLGFKLTFRHQVMCRSNSGARSLPRLSPFERRPDS